MKTLEEVEKNLMDYVRESLLDMDLKIKGLGYITTELSEIKKTIDLVKQESNVALQRAKNAELIKDPKNREQKLDVAIKSFDRLNHQVRDIQLKMEGLLTNNFIEIHTDEKIDALYKQSGKALKEVSAEFNVGMDMAYKLAHGDIRDVQTRDKLVKFFLRK